MESLRSDIKYALRNLLRRPAFTIIAVVTLALGIGANTAIFSALNALLLKPLPFPELDRVVAIWDKLPSRGVNHNEVTRVKALPIANCRLRIWLSVEKSAIVNRQLEIS